MIVSFIVKYYQVSLFSTWLGHSSCWKSTTHVTIISEEKDHFIICKYHFLGIFTGISGFMNICHYYANLIIYIIEQLSDTGIRTIVFTNCVSHYKCLSRTLIYTMGCLGSVSNHTTAVKIYHCHLWRGRATLPKFHFVSIFKWLHNFGLAVLNPLLHKTVQREPPSSAQICHLRPFQKRFFWDTVAKIGHEVVTWDLFKNNSCVASHRCTKYSALGIQNFSQVSSQTVLSCWAVSWATPPRSLIALNSPSRIWFQSSLTYPHCTVVVTWNLFSSDSCHMVGLHTYSKLSLT